jgi:hypothetical protein
VIVFSPLFCFFPACLLLSIGLLSLLFDFCWSVSSLLYFCLVSDIKILFELLHKCKFDDNLPEHAAVITIYNDLKHDLISDVHARVTIYEFTSWIAAHPLLISPLTKLQNHLRKQILGGDPFWSSMTKQRKEDVDQSRLDFLKTLKTSVLSCKIGSKPKKGKGKKTAESPAMKQRNKLTTISPTTVKDDIPTEPTILYSSNLPDSNESRKRASSSPTTTVTTTPSSEAIHPHHYHHGNNSGSHKPAGRGRVHSADQADSYDLLDSPISHSVSPVRRAGSNDIGDGAGASPFSSPSNKSNKPMIIKYEAPPPATTPSSKRQKGVVAATTGSPEVKSRKHHH